MNWIGDIVTGLIEHYETNDVLELCDCLGISIVRKKLNGIGSFFCRNPYGDEFILIDQSIDLHDSKSLIAHELGHAILHPGITTAFYHKSLMYKPKLERQADIFADALLSYGTDGSCEQIYSVY